MKLKDINWFWTAFIAVVLIGGIVSVLIGSPEPFKDATFLALLMGIARVVRG